MTAKRRDAPGFVRRASRLLRRHWSLVILIALAAPYLATVTTIHTDALSPVDEWVYIDYLYKLPSQGRVFEGEHVGEQTLERLACDGVSPFGPIGPACGSGLPAEEFPNEGYSSAAPYTPIYFAITRVVGDALAILPGVDQLTGWRLTGTLWLVGGLVILFILLRERRVSHGATLAIGLALVASPFSWWTFSYVNTDAPGFLVGALLLLLAARARHSRVARWWLFAVAILAILIKLTNLLGVALVALLFIVETIVARRQDRTFAAADRSSEPWRPLVFVGAGLAVGITAQLAWLWVVAATAVSEGRAEQGIAVPFTLDEVLLQVVHFLPGAITASPVTAYMPSFPYAPLGWLTVAGVLAALLVVRARLPRDTDALVIATAIAALCAAPALAIALQVANGAYFQLPPRYAATLLPAFLVVTGLVLRRRAAVVSITAYVAALLPLGLWFSLYLATLA